MIRAAADIHAKKILATRPRPPREAARVDDLADHAALVVMAHPDDEAIAAAAMLGRLKKAGVVCVTDGAPRRGNFAKAAGFDNWMDYARTRRGEAEAALALLGRPIAPLHGMGIADQDAAHHLVAGARHVAGQLRSGFSRVIAHAYEGGHPDHDSAAFMVHAACALLRHEGAPVPLIVEAPLYNAPSGTFEHSKFLPHPDAGPVANFPLSPAERDLKQRMFACHVTQKSVFEAFGTIEEKFRLAPRYHFAAPPHAGDVGYGQYMGAFTGKVWRRLAWRAMRELDLLDELA